MKKKFLFCRKMTVAILAFVLLAGLLPGITMTARAEEESSATLSEDEFHEGRTDRLPDVIPDGVSEVSPEGKTDDSDVKVTVRVLPSYLGDPETNFELPVYFINGVDDMPYIDLKDWLNVMVSLMYWVGDTGYGLKESHDITTFDRMFTETGYRNDLSSTDPNVADGALLDFISYYLDDLHSGFTFASYRSDKLISLGGEGLSGLTDSKNEEIFENARAAARYSTFPLLTVQLSRSRRLS